MQGPRGSLHVRGDGLGKVCADFTFSCVASSFAESLFDTKELVVLGCTVRAGERTRFDLTCSCGDREICDEGVLCLTAAVGDYRAVAVLACELDGLECLRERADLVEFDQDGVGDCFVDPLL